MNKEIIELIEHYDKQAKFNHQAFENAAARHQRNARLLKFGGVVLMGSSISFSIFDAPTSDVFNDVLGAAGIILELIDKDSASAKEADKCSEKAGEYLRLRDDFNIILHKYRGEALNEKEAWSMSEELIKRYEEVSAKGPQTNQRDYKKAEKFFTKEKGE